MSFPDQSFNTRPPVEKGEPKQGETEDGGASDKENVTKLGQGKTEERR